MIQGRLFLCNICGTDNLVCSYEHQAHDRKYKHKCPICHLYKLNSEDPLDNDWVALGEAVCSQQCHAEAYNLMRDRQLQLL